MKPDGAERFCSFHDIHAEASRRGAHLAARGVAKGDRVAMVIPEGDEFVLSFLGAIFAGAIPVPIYPQLSFKNVDAYHETVGHIARASGATQLLTTTTTREFVEPVLKKVETLRGILTVDELAPPAPAPLDVHVTPDDLAFLQFTSGSTSRPKGVAVTHANLSANSKAFMIDGLGKDSSVDKGVSWLPLYHDMGLIGFVIGPLFTDIPVVFLPTASFVRAPRIWLDTIHKHRGSITYAPNFAYALVTKRIKDKDVAGLDLSCMRITGCGAEPIQAKTLRDFAEKLAPPASIRRRSSRRTGWPRRRSRSRSRPTAQGCAPTASTRRRCRRGGEAGRADATADGQEIVDCGRVFPEHELAIVDDDGTRLGERQVGQIITRGPSITGGYFHEPELTAAAWKIGPDGETWLHTGDLGYLADGEVFICGRIKDIIIIRGRNFYPQDIEWVVSELPGVRRGNVVAFGVAVSRTVEEQLVVCAEAFQADAAGLIESISASGRGAGRALGSQGRDRPAGALPRTSSGKPQRRKTKQMFVDGTLPNRVHRH